MGLELIITIGVLFVSFIIWLVVNTYKATTKLNEMENKIAQCENCNKESREVLDMHSTAINEMRTEYNTVMHTFTNIELKIENLSLKSDETQILIQQNQRDNHSLFSELIKTINNVIVK